MEPEGSVTGKNKKKKKKKNLLCKQSGTISGMGEDLYGAEKCSFIFSQGKKSMFFGKTKFERFQPYFHKRLH
jgi:hypothetical protein